VGVSENMGNFMTFKILTDDTHKVISCSNLHSACDPNERNLSIDPLNTDPPEVIRSLQTTPPALDHGEELLPLSFDDSGHNKQDHLVIVNPYELVGRTFLMDPQDDGQHFRACIVDLVEDHQSKEHKSDNHHKFCISINDNQYEEVITYNELMDFIQKNEENDTIIWCFQWIIGHQRPFLCSDPDYKGSKFNVMVEWENRETTMEPLSVIAADDPVTCAISAKEHDLLDTEGWKCFRNMARREKHFLWLVKQAKLRSYRNAPKYKFGYQIPRDYEEAMKFDELNHNDKWDQSVKAKMHQLDVTEITQPCMYMCNSLFICQLYSLPNLLEETDCKEDTPLTLPFCIVPFLLTVDNSDMN
jgi:hypothetical protein